MSPDSNLHLYESREVVSHYATQSDLQPSETYLFQRYITQGMAILDMGVGGGRTTAYLASVAGAYIGADYSKPMIDAVGQRYPDLEFCLCDATNMSQFEDGIFDAVVFSFNGIDYIPTDGDRAVCLAETARVLKPGGIFIFSSHNACMLGQWPDLADAKLHQLIWRSIRSAWKSVGIARRILTSGVFKAGEGYVHDPVHGGLRTYVSTPETIAPSLERVGMEILEAIGGPCPKVKASILTPWYYYACRKTLAT
jgi:SAM-dependent methyltransferase